MPGRKKSKGKIIWDESADHTYKEVFKQANWQIKTMPLVDRNSRVGDQQVVKKYARHSSQGVIIPRRTSNMSHFEPAFLRSKGCATIETSKSPSVRGAFCLPYGQTGETLNFC